jgi:light-regulated signal transduction histidine kinase (bacteriophytochrome)
MSDNAIGCDSKNHQRVFRVFKRIHGQAEIEGDGMGRAGCEKIVERHGGMIVANAELETGATFIVTISAP